MSCKVEEDMSDEEAKAPEIGALLIDGRSLAGILMDAEPGATQRRRRAQPGLDHVIKEIIDKHEEIGSKVGVLGDQVTDIQTATKQIALIESFLPAAQKFVEMCNETIAILDHQRHEQISAIASIIDTQASALKRPDLRAHYEKTRAYRSSIAKKAAKTRRKKAKAEASEQKQEAAEAAAQDES